MAEIGVIGSGSWGTALAKLLALNGHTVRLWTYEREVCEQVRTTRENRVFLPGVPLEENIYPACELEWVVAERDLLLIVVPSHVYRNVVKQMVECLKGKCVIVSATKGIENQTLCLMSDILEEILPDRFHAHLSFLSGPSFAKEVARGLPTAVTLAAHSGEVARYAQDVFSNRFFRVYTSNDVIGVELGGALKNIIAIAAGVTEGLELGANAMAALVTRGLAEMTRFGVAMGANPLTFAGLAGMGDLVLTCTGALSRNRQVGLQLGKGSTLGEILEGMIMVAEGVNTARSIHDLARREGIELPICEQVYEILYRDKPPMKALEELMSRELKAELSGDDWIRTRMDPV